VGRLIAASFGEREGILGSRDVDHVRMAAVRERCAPHIGKTLVLHEVWS
jgi:hypothetical protein